MKNIYIQQRGGIVGFDYRNDLLVKRDCIEKSWLNVYSKIFDNRFLVGVEFKFLKLR